MNFLGSTLITEDVPRLSRFYQDVLQATAEGDDIHVEFETEGASLTIYAKHAAERDMAFDFSTHWGTGSVTLNFRVDDVDAEYARLQTLGVAFITQPKTYPWGNRAVHFWDPDGNIVGFSARCK